MQSWINYRWDLTMDELLFLSLFVIDPRKLYSRRLYPMVHAYSITKTQTDIRLKSVFVLFFPHLHLSCRQASRSIHSLSSSHLAQGVLYIMYSSFWNLFIYESIPVTLASVNRLHRWEITGPFINDMTSARA